MAVATSLTRKLGSRCTGHCAELVWTQLMWILAMLLSPRLVENREVLAEGHQRICEGYLRIWTAISCGWRLRSAMLIPCVMGMLMTMLVGLRCFGALVLVSYVSFLEGPWSGGNSVPLRRERY